MRVQKRCGVRYNPLPHGKGQDVVCPAHAATSAKCDKRQIRFIDLFAGCGGLSEGFYPGWLYPCCTCGGI